MLQRKDRSLSQAIGRVGLFSRKGKVQQLPTLPEQQEGFFVLRGAFLTRSGSLANANYGRS